MSDLILLWIISSEFQWSSWWVHAIITQGKLVGGKKNRKSECFLKFVPNMKKKNSGQWLFSASESHSTNIKVGQRSIHIAPVLASLLIFVGERRGEEEKRHIQSCQSTRPPPQHLRGYYNSPAIWLLPPRGSRLSAWDTRTDRHTHTPQDTYTHTVRLAIRTFGNTP